MNGVVPSTPVRIAAEILQHFQHNPEARDAAEGIAQWWVHQPIDLVRHALEVLTALHFINVRTVGGNAVYEAAEGKDREIREWLAKLG